MGLFFWLKLVTWQLYHNLGNRVHGANSRTISMSKTDDINFQKLSEIDDKTGLVTTNFFAVTPNIVCSDQSARNPHKYWAERDFSSKFGTQHLGGGRSGAIRPAPPSRVAPAGRPTGKQMVTDPTPIRNPDLRQVFLPCPDDKYSMARICSPGPAALRAASTDGSGAAKG